MGFFALMLAGPFWLSLVGKALLVLAFAPLAIYRAYGINRHIWSLRNTLSEAGKKELGRLRVAGALLTALLVGSMIAAFGAWALRSAYEYDAQNAVVITAFSASLLALAGGARVRTREYRLYKSASERHLQAG